MCCHSVPGQLEQLRKDARSGWSILEAFKRRSWIFVSQRALSGCLETLRCCFHAAPRVCVHRGNLPFSHEIRVCVSAAILSRST